MFHKRYFYDVIISYETKVFQIALLELRTYFDFMFSSVKEDAH